MDLWRVDGNQRKNQAASSKESWSNDNMSDRLGAGGRRLSDGAPVPFNRTRSFKTKQLVRSQAIRESQSPPRVPSPRPPGHPATDTDRTRIQPAVKKKAVSVDLDDRNTTSTSGTLYVNHQNNPGKLDRGSSSNNTKSDGNDSKADGNIPKPDGMDYSKSGKMEYSNPNNQQKISHSHVNKNSVKVQSNKQYEANIRYVKNHNDKLNVSAIAKNSSRDIVDNSNATASEFGIQKASPISIEENIKTVKTTWANNNNVKRSNMNVETGGTVETSKDFANRPANSAKQTEVKKLGAVVVTELKVASENSKGDSGVASDKNKGFSVASDGRKGASDKKKENSENASDTGVVKHAANCTCVECVIVSVVSKGDKDTKISSNVGGGDKKVSVTGEPGTCAVKQILRPDRGSLSEARGALGVSGEDEKAGKKSPNRSKVEFQQVEIQVTSGDNDSTQASSTVTQSGSQNVEKECDMRRCMLEENEEEDSAKWGPNSRGRRAICPSKQDSGICCWEQCACCGDVSPDLNIQYFDENEEAARQSRRLKFIAGYDFQYSLDQCRSVDRWNNRRAGSTLVVQRGNSGNGNNLRLLRKQSSGGSVDSSQHSLGSSTPYLSRDNSSEIVPAPPLEPTDLDKFVKETLNKSYKDRLALLKLEHEMMMLIKDPNCRTLKFPQLSSYSRMLVHRCADLFCLKHGLDMTTKQIVYVTKPAPGTATIPQLCPFQQWCTEQFWGTPGFDSSFCENSPQAKSILKRDAHSLDEEAAALQPSKPTARSKSFEQREEEYSRARRRIFNTTEDGVVTCDWLGTENDPERPRLLMPEGDRSQRAGRLLKVQSLESREPAPVIRGIVSKAHSFGGYGDRREGIRREDSTASAHSAPPTRILSQKGELAINNWRLSPGNSSGYRTLSARSDSITPSPTPNMTVDLNAGSAPGVLWAITDMGSVPPGALIIHPPTGQPLFNSDGSVYYYDPERPPSSLMTKSQIQVEGVRVLTNPERRRSRLEKQRATLSPGTETDANTEKLKSPDLRENAELTNTKNPIDQMKPLHEEIVPHTTTNFNLTPQNAESKPICACQDCQTKANTNPTNNSIDQTYQHQNPTIQHNIADPTSQAYKQNIQQAKQSTTTKDIYSQCDIATNESQISLPLVEKLSAKPSTEGLKSASPNLIAAKSSVNNKEMYASDSNNMSNNPGKPEISVNAVITEETMEDCLKSVLRNTTPRDGCAPKEEFNVLKDDAVIQFGYVKPDDFKDCKKFAGGLSEHQLMQNLAQKPYDYAANMAAGNLEEEKPECCVREEGLYDPIIQERNQEYMVAPVFPDSGYYANAPPMGQFYNNLYEDPNPELQQQYQAGQMALQQRGASHPSSGLMQPSPMVFPHHLMQNPMHQSPYPVQSEEVHPFQVQAPPPPPPGLVPQHPPQLFQVQGAPGWGWPVVYGAPQSQAQPLQDIAGSKMPHHGSQFIPQASEPPMNPVPTMQAGFYPQAVLMAPQPPQYYPFQPNPHQLISMQHPQQQQPIPPPYAIYHQPYQPERSSVLSQEGSTTPGFNMQYDTTLTPQQNFNINQFNQSLDLMKQRNFQTKSPKNNLVNSRGQSDSGSSRATPLMTYQGYSTAAASSVQNFGGMEGQGFLNAMHFGQQNAASNYGILPFSYPPNDGLLQNVQFENGNAKSRHNTGVKPWGKDVGDYPRNSYNDRKEATNQMERNMDAIQRADSMFVENQEDRFNKLRDRRKVFRTATSGGSLSRQDSFDQDGQSAEQPPNQSNFNRSIDGRSRFNNGKIVDKPPNLDLKDITFSNEQQKARFVPISKELADRVATSNLSNEAKAFIPKDIPTTEQATTTASVETEVQASVVTTSAPSTSVAAASSEDKPTVNDDSKNSNQSVVTNTDRKPLFHNKQNVNTNMNVKNFNNANSLNRNNRDGRQGYRNTTGVGGVHDYKGGIRNERDDKSFRSYFQREPASPTVQTRTATATATWVQRNIDSPVQRCSNGSSANASPAPVFSFPNLSHPPPTQNQNISSYVRAPSAYQHHSTSQHSQRVNHSGNPLQGHPAYPRYHNLGHLSNVQCQYGNGNPLQGHPAYPRNHNMGHLSNVQCQFGNGNAAALNKEFGPGVGAYGLAKTGFRGNAQGPIANPAGGMGLVQQSLMGQQRLQEQLLQRSQLLQSFGGAGLMQTPPAQGALLFRQIPNWLRRAQAPGIFGPPPAYAARAARPPPPAPR